MPTRLPFRNIRVRAWPFLAWTQTLRLSSEAAVVNAATANWSNRSSFASSRTCWRTATISASLSMRNSHDSRLLGVLLEGEVTDTNDLLCFSALRMIRLELEPFLQ